jgi:hypothetical protein
LPEPGLKGSTLTHSLIEGKIVSSECCPTVRLGRIKGKIGVAEKLSRIVAVIGSTGHTDARSDIHRLAFKHERLTYNCCHDTRSQHFGCLAIMRVRLKNDELVAAKGLS